MNVNEYVQQAVSILIELGKDNLPAEIKGQLVAAILGELGKDRRMAQLKHEKEAKQEKWRKDPATPEQLFRLKQHNVLHNANITKGEASDLIDFHRRTQG